VLLSSFKSNQPGFEFIAAEEVRDKFPGAETLFDKKNLPGRILFRFVEVSVSP
jgi:hypothetical protein